MSKRTEYDAEEVRAILAARVSKHGDQRKLAGALGVSASHLNDILRGQRGPSPALLKGLGMERVTTYRFKAESDAVSVPMTTEKRFAALEARVYELEERAERNAPAMRAAWMNVPIGGR